MRLTALLVAAFWLVGASAPPSAQQSAPRPGQWTQPAAAVADDEGVVQGRVTDGRTGQPLPGASVTLAPTFVGATSRSADTDVDGRYEISALAPGQHRLYVGAEAYSPYGGDSRGTDAVLVDVVGGRRITGIDAALDRASAISGRVFDVAGEGFAGVEVELLVDRYLPGGRRKFPVAFGRTDPQGLFRVEDLPAGTYYVGAYRPRARSRVPDDTNAIYALTYFPGTLSPDAAVPLVVAPGQELAGLDYTLLTQAPVDVAGTVVDVSGEPVDGTMVSIFPLVASRSSRGVDRVAASEAGHFAFADVLPGDYSALAIKPGVGLVNQPIAVDGPVSDLVLVLHPGVRVSGRVLVEREGNVPVAPEPSLLVRAETWTAFGGQIETLETAPVHSDGSFQLDGVVGPATLRVAGLPAGWTVAEVRHGGVDITDVPTDFSPTAGRPIDIVVARRQTEIEGIVVDDRGRSVSTYAVVVFAEDPRRWTPGSRSVRGSVARHDGSFQFTDLPPTDYLVVAVPGLPSNAWVDPDVLRVLRPRATRLRPRAGEHRTLGLELSPTPSGLIP